MDPATDPDSSFNAIFSVTVGLTSLVVLLRCYMRIVIQKSFAADNYLILVSQVCFCGYSAIMMRAVKHGLGQHQVNILRQDPHNLVVIMQVST